MGEANLLWTIGQRRRKEGGFVGADIILKQRAEKSAPRKRVGFVAEGPPARQGSLVLNAEGEQVGIVTSGLKGPSVGKNIGMAYVQPKYQKAGTELSVQVRKKVSKFTVSKMPFVEARYYRGA